jgi:protein-disulfide isomerase
MNKEKELGMKRILIAAGILSMVLVGCQKSDSSEIAAKLDEINKKLDSLDEKMAKVGTGAAAPRRPSRPTPDPNKVYSVPVAGSPYRGPEHAKVTIVKAFEFACPYCERVRPTMKAIKEKYGNDVKIVYKHLLVHPQVATDASLAACAAHRQGKYAEMEELIWEKGYKANRNLGKDNMETLAKEVGLDMNKYKADIEGECKGVLQKDQNDVRKVGAGGTPSFFINGRFISGARPQQMFEAVIDQELKKANEALAKGAKLETYYDEYVVKKGLKSLQAK